MTYSQTFKGTYDPDQTAAEIEKVEAGAGGLSAGAIATGAITTAKLAANAVTTAKITDANVTAAKLAADSVTTVKILDGAVTAAKLASSMSAIETVAVTVTNAQLKALRATPKTLVAAGGAGTVIEFLGAVLALTAGANVLTESGANLSVKYINGSGVAVSDTIESTGFIDQAADTITSAVPVKDAIVASVAGAVNKALVLHNVGGSEIAGNAAADAVLKVYVTYRTITL